MEVIEVPEITYARPDVFSIYPLGDVHMGSRQCDEEGIKRKVTQVRSEKNAYWIGMGDYADAILKNDKRFDVGGLAEWVKGDNIIELQREHVRDLFNPIKKQCLGFLTGNHEETLHINDQNDLTRNLCKDLGVTYGGYSCFISLKFKRSKSNEVHQYIIHAFHGSGAAQQEGARMMRLMRLVNDIEADIYLMGHLHTITTYAPSRLVYRNGKIKSVPIHAVMTGSWLKAYAQPDEGEQLNSSYAERAGYKPNVLGCPCIKIKPDTQQVWIES
jgi:predicted phosphodiesterase